MDNLTSMEDLIKCGTPLEELTNNEGFCNLNELSNKLDFLKELSQQDGFSRIEDCSQVFSTLENSEELKEDS